MSLLRVTRYAVQVLYSTASNLPTPVTLGGGTTLTDRASEADNLEFAPFVDTAGPSERKRTSLQYKISPSSPTGLAPLEFHNISGSNTTEIDGFRQGVEITSEFYRSAGITPKIWAGNIKGRTSVTTVGQGASFTEIQKNKAWTDKAKFDPVEYIGSPVGANAWGVPVNLSERPIGNDGEAIIELLNTVSSSFAREHFYGVHGSVEDGNKTNPGRIAGSSTRIEQNINTRDKTLVPFTDNNGAKYVGNAGAVHLQEHTSSISFFYPLRTNTLARNEEIGGLPMVVTGAVNGVTYFSGPIKRGLGTVGGEETSIFSAGEDVAEATRGPILSGAYDSRLDGVPINLTVQYLWKPPVVSADAAQTRIHGGFFGPGDGGGTFPWLIIEVAASNLLVYSSGDTSTDLVGMGSSGFGGTGLPASKTTFKRGEWNHIAFTQNANNHVTFFINGEVVEEKTLTGQTSLSIDVTRGFWFMGGQAGADPFATTAEGHFADLHIIPGVVYTQEQMRASANALIGKHTFVTHVFGSSSVENGVTPPYDDLGKDKILNQLTNAGWTDFLKISGSVNLENDIRQQHAVRSATAGTDVYGPSQGQYGTDSIAFTGYLRGS